MFDDRPVEISELTYIIKHDIAAINRQLSDLQAFNKLQAAKRGGGGPKGKAPQDKAEEHRGNVVTLLQTKLAGATTSFQDILEIRTQVSPRLSSSRRVEAELTRASTEHEGFARPHRAICLQQHRRPGCAGRELRWVDWLCSLAGVSMPI